MAFDEIYFLLVLLYRLELFVSSSYQIEILLPMLVVNECFMSFQVLKNNSDGSENGSLLQIMNHTLTIFGSRLLRHWV